MVYRFHGSVWLLVHLIHSAGVFEISPREEVMQSIDL